MGQGQSCLDKGCDGTNCEAKIPMMAVPLNMLGKKSADNAPLVPLHTLPVQVQELYEGQSIQVLDGKAGARAKQRYL